ncbi:DNA polymerase IV [Gilvimarinus sp. F26214L]|uniref:DNA polymerase IV n=1 Tax=Gilvimarinus sp. DZF01 TaxID=3461371 RepID=UPI0040462694
MEGSEQNNQIQRKIIHCDADCFFAAVEMREDPSLRGRPLAVGGASEGRGVIATCNYEARSHGVRSAMPSAQARRLCPDLLIVPPNMNLYRDVSLQIREIFHGYTDLVEPLSLDEAFLDVSQTTQCKGSATLIAQEIRQRIRDQLGITVSAGVAPNKFLAKIASDWRKPDGLTVIEPGGVADFVRDLPVSKIYGVGRVSAQKLHNMGVETCGQLQAVDELSLVRQFGSMGLRLHQLSRGVDDRPVKSTRSRQSVSVEHTYPADLQSVERCLNELPALYMQLRSRLRRLDKRYRVVKAFVKVKFTDFTTTTLERAGTGLNLDDYHNLCSEAWQRRAQPVRLLGLGVRLLDLEDDGLLRQLDLFDH